MVRDDLARMLLAAAVPGAGRGAVHRRRVRLEVVHQGRAAGRRRRLVQPAAGQARARRRGGDATPRAPTRPSVTTRSGFDRDGHDPRPRVRHGARFRRVRRQLAAGAGEGDQPVLRAVPGAEPPRPRPIHLHEHVARVVVSRIRRPAGQSRRGDQPRPGGRAARHQRGGHQAAQPRRRRRGDPARQARPGRRHQGRPGAGRRVAGAGPEVGAALSGSASAARPPTPAPTRCRRRRCGSRPTGRSSPRAGRPRWARAAGPPWPRSPRRSSGSTSRSPVVQSDTGTTRIRANHRRQPDDDAGRAGGAARVRRRAPQDPRDGRRGLGCRRRARCRTRRAG